jgi:beta-N-acetylhexosaminidase
MPPSLALPVLCGQLLVGGFATPGLSATFRQALERGERGGAILFRRNLGGSAGDVAALTRALGEAAPPHLPPLVGVDQEGGRVARLGPPVLRLPPMRALGRLADAGLVGRAARTLGAQLAALGFTMSFAPVLDVDTCPVNPVIGDRSFGSDPSLVARLGAAFAAGLQAGGVMACGKHFPGHGDTTVDSHKDLPRVARPRARLDAVELVPFRDLPAGACAALMTAHVVYEALDADQPATLSRRIAHDLLRVELGWRGLVVSDDLEMKAVADRLPIEQSAVQAVRAGCDLLLVCASEDLQDRAHAALVRAAERDASFREQVEASVARGLEARRRRPPRPVAGDPLLDGAFGVSAQEVARALEDRGVFG